MKEEQMEIAQEDFERMAEMTKAGQITGLRVQTGGEPYVGPIMGLCDGEQCGWWSSAGQCCNMAYLGAIAMALTEKGRDE